MKVERLGIPDIVLLTPPRFGDARGWFSEVFHAQRMQDAGVPGPFVQDNQSFSAAQGTVRGLHCQIGANVQGKLVRVIQGAIWDVAVDLRQGSPTFGQHAAAHLSAEDGAQLWVPPGFLHGFATTAPDTMVLYKVTAQYDRDAERGVAWDDPDLALPWPVSAADAVLSAKDAQLPRLAACEAWFRA